MQSLEHPNIIDVIYADLDRSDPYFVMPFAERTLKQEIRKARTTVVREAWAHEVFIAIASGVRHAHGHDIIHRDLKPENVLFVHGVLKVADFGLGKDLTAEGTAGLTAPDEELGTPLYRAPEQIRGREAGKPADVFALGKLLVEMLTGAEATLGVPDVGAVPHRYREYIDRCCAHDARDRFQDADAMVRALPEHGT
jgi:serine/threonine-protein kinase